jgi:hypothetical protein
MPPNVIFLNTDQQSRYALGASDNPWVHTPNFDALAASGVRFTRAYCAAPVCGPSWICLACRFRRDAFLSLRGSATPRGVRDVAAC